eukprot:CAMPEP_0175140722 /NCGR_PEP_ID=MMETSP0087-20121206/11683_1 /TAXON_ID=136419 /ORGANISM="Unknown Unknown, Strain D1" /LENGTH=567 /DNA_ID=CAMNT_0016424009 /DNA_START=40 /DNA_END=1743 /DNA_ORIENTATION=-
MADEIAALKAEIAKLQAEKSALANQYAPTLRKRVTIRTVFAEADRLVGQYIGVGGWSRTIRSAGGGKFAFIKLYDGTCGNELQVVALPECPGFKEATVDNGPGCAMFIVGEIVPSMGKEQKVEMKATEIRVLGPSDPATYPLAGKGLSLEYLRTIGHFRPRTMVLGAVTRIRNALAMGTHMYFQEQGYQYVHTPLITASDCEGGGEMFQVTTLIKDDDWAHKLPNGKPDFTKDFFKRPAFLTVSGQLNAEIYATAMSSVYTFGPTFRAEDSHTTRHLSEFWMIEPEIAFADLSENMDIAEGFLKYVLNYAVTRCPEDIATLEQFEQRQIKERAKALEKEKLAQSMKDKADKKAAAAKAKADKAAGKPVEKAEKKKSNEKKTAGPPQAEWRSKPLRERLNMIINSSFARVTYTECIELLLKAVSEGKQFVEEVKWGMDMGSEHERFLCEVLFARPTIVTDYPKDIKAFYMRANEDGKTCAAMDILVPGVGELIGGSQREERLDILVQRVKELGLNEEDYKWYLDLRRFGSVPHSGFGAGFERLVCYTTGIDNIRDVIPFPRYPGHAEY